MRERVVLFEKKEECCGCGVCANMCPTSAIVMEEDECGYVYPCIDEKKCISCGKCLNNCGYKSSNERKRNPINCYAAINISEVMARRSASGGFFSAVAASFIEQGGYIVGAVEKLVDGSFVFEHLVGSDEKSLRLIQGSKYVQSNAYGIYDEIKHLLKDGKKVLFSGTPCQVDAVRMITGDPDNLFTIDLICHGIPSQKMFNDSIKILEKDLNNKVKEFVFRTKNKDLEGYWATVISDRKKYIIPHWLLSYYYLFLEGLIFRKNCYSCPYACKERVADVTIGDFWGIEKKHTEEIRLRNVGNTKNWSSVLVNSEKGQRLIREYKKYLYLVPSSYENIAAENMQIICPSIEPKERESLILKYAKKGYIALEKEVRHKLGGQIKFWIKRKILIKKYRN